MKGKSQLMLSVTIILWGLAFPLVKLILTEVPPLTLALIRSVLASAFLLIQLQKSSKIIKSLLNDWKTFSLLGLTGVTFYHAFQNVGQQFTTASNSSVIIASNPVFIAFFSYLYLNEEISLKKICGIILALLGTIVVIFLGNPSNSFSDNPTVIGDLISLGAAINWAIYSVYGKRVLTKYDVKEATAFSIIFGTFFLVPITFVLEKPVLPKTSWLWIPILILSLLCSGLAYLFWYEVLEKIEASKLGVFLFFIPVISVSVSHLILLEPISIFFVLGTTLVLLGVLITERS